MRKEFAVALSGLLIIFPAIASDVFVEDIILENVGGMDPSEFCRGDVIVIKALIDSFTDETIELKVYIDGILHDVEREFVDGEGIVVFGRSLDTDSLTLGRHTVKVTAIANGRSERTEYFYIYSCDRCTPGYLDEYRCFGNWRQRRYLHSDCTSEWVNWEYCEYGCSFGECRNERCWFSLTIETPREVRVDDEFEVTVEVKNRGSVGGYIDLNGYVCSGTCRKMECEEGYVPGGSTKTFLCWGSTDREGSYYVRISYSGCDSGVVLSRSFSAFSRPRCLARYHEIFRCSGNWREQLYTYSDCTQAWVKIERCEDGCVDGRCVSKGEEYLSPEIPQGMEITPIVVVLIGLTVAFLSALIYKLEKIRKTAEIM